jgi:hypothetical protein
MRHSRVSYRFADLFMCAATGSDATGDEWAANHDPKRRAARNSRNRPVDRCDLHYFCHTLILQGQVISTNRITRYTAISRIRSLPIKNGSKPLFLPDLRQRRLIWFQVSPRSRKNFGDAFDTGRQRALQELNALRKLLRIAVRRLPCFVENADKYRHAGCLSTQATRRIVQLRWRRVLQVAETDERDVF